MESVGPIPTVRHTKCQSCSPLTLPAPSLPRQIGVSLSNTIPTEILLVEDDVDARTALSDILELDDYHVVTAGTLAEAMTSDRQWNRVLAVVLDRRLPDGTADDILPELSRLAPDTAIIIATGYADVDSAIAALRHGATDYLTKPIQPDRLRNSLSMISAKRRAEQMFETAINAAPTAMLLVNSDGRIIFANEQAVQTFGYSTDELVGEPVEVIVPVEFRDAHLRQFSAYVQDPASRAMAKGRELSAVRKDGTIFPAAVTLTAVESPGELLVLGVVEDITERKKAEALREVEIQLGVARRVQQNLFPSQAPVISGYDVAGAAFPADATGGDYFDFIALPDNKHALVLGDVSGHGIGPAMVMALARSYLRATALTLRDPGAILSQVNGLLSEDIETGAFMTLFWAELNPDTNELRYAAAGHIAHVIHTDGTTTELDPTGLVLGPMADADIATVDAPSLQHGEILLLTTDGIWEAHNADDEQYGLERTIDFVREHRNQPAQTIVNSLYEAVSEFSSPTPQADDITAIVIKALGST